MIVQNNNKYTRAKPALGWQIALGLIFVSATAHAQTPEIVDASAVQNCHLLEHIEASSGYGKSANWKTLAEHSAMSQAEKLGASHIVLEQFEVVGGFNGVVTAGAYQCNGAYAANTGSDKEHGQSKVDQAQETSLFGL